ncbi:hypothetical protein FQN60_007149 [Etheostoma spectabile]|uniref:Uncharacterized protein n=1 Tax=Etheostoma spectabile TaxID=54343 RepID=A0A5J5CBC9_9PERO|nr:hypothetical protein FQN60_007149 [Etheostoma spectabile]
MCQTKECQLARMGITKVIEAWNAHRIPGNTKELAKRRGPAKIPVDLLMVLLQLTCISRKWDPC